MNRCLITAFLPMLALAACGGDEPDGRIDDPRPVDGPYYVSIENDFGDDCYVEMIPADGPVYVFDALRRGDGNLDLVGNAMIVGPYVIENVVHDRGNIRHTATYKPYYWFGDGEPPDHRIEVAGTLTPDAVDLEIVSTEDDCVSTSRIRGRSRPLRDLRALDGHYLLAGSDLGSVCPGEDMPTTGTWNTLVNLTDTGVSGTVMLELEGGVYITIPRPGSDGVVDWSGDFIWYYDSYMILDMTGKLTGTLLPDKVDLLLEYDFVDYPSECPSYLELAGQKRLPTLDRVDNDYRLHIDVSTTCPEEGEDPQWSLERTATIVSQTDGRIVLQDITGDYLLELDNGTFATEFGYPGYFTVELSGDVDPPYLNYGFVVTEYDAAGEVSCQLTADYAGMVRYVFPE